MRIFKRGAWQEKKKNKIRMYPVSEPGARILTVTSGKGGVGKTNFTVNLAIALAQAGQRVVVFDADLGLANVDVVLGVTPRWSLYDHLYRNVPMEQVLFPGPGGIKVVSGGSGFLELANLTSQQRGQLVQSLEQLDLWADFILIDTGAGLSKDVLAFCAAADDVLVVITPEPTSLTDAYGLIKVLDRFKLQQEVYFIINMSRRGGEAADTVGRLKNVVNTYLGIGLNYLGDLCYDQAVISSVKKQTPFLLAKPNSKAAVAIQKIAQTMLSNTINVHGVEMAAGESGLKGFINKLGRLFK